jgi:hypothetical protein
MDLMQRLCGLQAARDLKFDNPDIKLFCLHIQSIRELVGQ